MPHPFRLLTLSLVAACGAAMATPALAQATYPDHPVKVIVALPAGGYLALRQGGYSIQQRGDSRLADGAERMAHAVGRTGLRVATAAPDSTRAAKA